MGILAKILGSDKVIDKGFGLADKITDMGDDAVFTGQEKASYQLQLLKAYQPFKLIQRYLALMFTGVFLLLVLLSAFLIVWSAFTGNIEVHDSAIEIGNLIKENLWMIVLSIMALYFGGGALESAKRLFRGRKSKK